MEIITISRQDYQNDLIEAAKQGALMALKEHEQGDEWLTMEEAMSVVRLKSQKGFREYRRKNKIYGSEKVKISGRQKLFNKKHLI